MDLNGLGAKSKSIDKYLEYKNIYKKKRNKSLVGSLSNRSTVFWFTWYMPDDRYMFYTRRRTGSSHHKTAGNSLLNLDNLKNFKQPVGVNIISYLPHSLFNKRDGKFEI